MEGRPVQEVRIDLGLDSCSRDAVDPDIFGQRSAYRVLRERQNSPYDAA